MIRFASPSPLLLRLAALASLAVAVPAAAFDWTGMTFDGLPCSGRGQSFGPWDYFDVNEPSDAKWEAGRWWEVRVIHQEPGLEALNALDFGQIEYNRAAAEFDYILRAFPNQPRTLGAVVELELKARRSSTRIRRWETPPECYLQRAKAFRPNQPHVDQLMGYFLQHLGRTEEALDYYRRALELNSENAEVYYNIGLAYFDMENYKLARENARKAYDLGFPLQGLRHRLVKVGAWEPIDKQGCR